MITTEAGLENRLLNQPDFAHEQQGGEKLLTQSEIIRGVPENRELRDLLTRVFEIIHSRRLERERAGSAEPNRLQLNELGVFTKYTFDKNNHLTFVDYVFFSRIMVFQMGIYYYSDDELKIGIFIDILSPQGTTKSKYYSSVESLDKLLDILKTFINNYDSDQYRKYPNYLLGYKLASILLE